jgi:hypothetical protein
MYSNYDISALDSWLGVVEGGKSVTEGSVVRKPLIDIALAKKNGRHLCYKDTESKVLFLKRVFIYKYKYKENDFSLCSSVTHSAGRIVPNEEVLASAELARQRNRRDRDLIALMHPFNVIEWTWIEHADGRWSAHHSQSFEESV